MPVVVVCGVKFAALFDLDSKETYYLREDEQRALAEKWLMVHRKTCKETHSILPCIDPFEMRGI